MFKTLPQGSLSQNARCAKGYCIFIHFELCASVAYFAVKNYIYEKIRYGIE